MQYFSFLAISPYILSVITILFLGVYCKRFLFLFLLKVVFIFTKNLQNNWTTFPFFNVYCFNIFCFEVIVLVLTILLLTCSYHFIVLTNISNILTMESVYSTSCHTSTVYYYPVSLFKLWKYPQFLPKLVFRSKHLNFFSIF